MTQSRQRAALLSGIAMALPIAAGAGALLAYLRRRLNDTRALQDLIFSSTVDGILLLEEDGTIAAFNPAAERMFGYAAAEVTGGNVRLLIPEPYHAAYRLLSSGVAVVGRHKSGTTFPIDLTSGQARLGGQRLYIGVARDLTRLARTQAELAAARDVAEAASRAKSAFLLAMSHELRTPLNHILGYSELLLEEAHEPAHAALAPDIRKIHDSGLHLLRMVEQVLDLTAIEGAALTLSPRELDPERLVRELAARHKRRLSLVVGAAPPVHADPDRLRQALLQLIESASAASGEGAVTLELALDRALDAADTTEVVFSVSASGQSLPPELIERLFEPFAQLGQAPAGQGDPAGLGLALAARLVQLMGGRMTVTSAPEHGTTYRLHLPALRPA